MVHENSSFDYSVQLQMLLVRSFCSNKPSEQDVISCIYIHHIVAFIGVVWSLQSEKLFWIVLVSSVVVTSDNFVDGIQR